MLDDRVQLRDVDPGVAVDARHLVVDLGDDDLGGLDRCLVRVDVGAEAHVAVPVGARDADHRHADVDELEQQPRHLVEVVRDVVCGARLHGVAVEAVHEQRLPVDHVGEVRREDGLGGGPHREQAGHAQVAEPAGARTVRHRLNQRGRLAHGVALEHEGPVRDERDRLGGRAQLVAVRLDGVRHRSLLSAGRRRGSAIGGGNGSSVTSALDAAPRLRLRRRHAACRSSR